MAKKNRSSTIFWAKQFALALVLIIIAGIVIYLQRTSDTSPEYAEAPKEKSISNGLSEFYREFRTSSTDPIEEEGDDFVLDVDRSEAGLDQQLRNMASNQKPVNQRWVGEHKFRTFKAGNTVREAITAYAQQEGMQIIWDLDQDFVIKHQFQIDNTIVGSLAKIASAIDSNFMGEVKTYVCPDQRSLVVTAEVTDYLKSRCNSAESR
ncbi:hypothetical protein CA267_014915 [Alteromonas pelagimontana]|uniref:Toxin co-regulated pilus biosynthesis protein Q C-terminal domain-containing protein n=1 Tax=Alteromonas pelagimontana TaxID=1858656 RepID=A0A6M4MFW1_9ALTE|nr:TcpQ domain-containing protein [Alteromonas pelagimontana]QJR81952.1 hypothetical protein CA267_014915 [Alteromonas pelagimontana]